MKHLYKYESYTLAESALPKMDWHKVETLSGKKANPEDKEKVSNFFNKVFSGPLVQDPSSWEKDYKSKMTGYRSTATGKTEIPDTGFSGLVGGLASLGKGLAKKMFGKPANPNIPGKTEEFFTPQHQRLFMDNVSTDIHGLKDEREFGIWANDQYKKRGVKPNQNPAFDEVMQASYLKWMDPSKEKPNYKRPINRRSSGKSWDSPY